MKRFAVSATFILFIWTIAFPQNPERDSTGISLLFIGDIMGHDDQIRSALDTTKGAYCYDNVFQYVKGIISEADIAIANLEVTLAGAPYRGYPAFSSPAALAQSCRNAGIDILATANNHSADRGKKGITGTIQRLDSLGIRHTGTFTGQREKDSLQPLLIESDSFRLALLNYTYGTNGIKVPVPVIVNMLVRDQVSADIAGALRLDPDAVILFLHWGTEYDTIPSADQEELAEHFSQQGARLIIGSHPHVIQKMVWEKSDTSGEERLIAYSLGNFVSNQRKQRTDGGLMLKIDLAKEAGSVFIADAGYYLTWVYTPVEDGKKRFYILPCSEFEDRPEFFSRREDYEKMLTFIVNSRKLLEAQNKGIGEIIFSEGRWLH